MSITLNQAKLEQTVDMAHDICVLELSAVSVPCTASMVIIDAEWEKVTDGGLTTGSTSTGLITAGRAGEALVTISGSWATDVATAQDYNLEVYVDGSVSGLSVLRSLSASGSYGSFAAKGILTIASAETIALWVGGRTANLTFEHLSICVEWQS